MFDTEVTPKRYYQQSIGSGCGSVGRAPAFDTRGPRFESNHRQKFIYWTFIYSQLYWKDENKGKRCREWPNFFLKKPIHWFTLLMNRVIELCATRLDYCPLFNYIFKCLIPHKLSLLVKQWILYQRNLILVTQLLWKQTTASQAKQPNPGESTGGQL